MRLEKLLEIAALVLLNPIKGSFKWRLLAMNILYSVLSATLAVYTFTFVRKLDLRIAVTLQILQTIIPTLLSAYVAVDVIKTKKISLMCKIYDQSCSSIPIIKLIGRLLILVVVRSIKIYIALDVSPVQRNVAYALCTMLPELVSSMSDFLFVLFIELLTGKIRKFNKNLISSSSSCVVIVQAAREMAQFHETSLHISRYYAPRLLATITFNFLQVVISLYWIFVRVAFNHFDGKREVFGMQTALAG